LSEKQEALILKTQKNPALLDKIVKKTCKSWNEQEGKTYLQNYKPQLKKEVKLEKADNHSCAVHANDSAIPVTASEDRVNRINRIREIFADVYTDTTGPEVQNTAQADFPPTSHSERPQQQQQQPRPVSSSRAFQNKYAWGLFLAGGILVIISLPSIAPVLGLHLATNILNIMCSTGGVLATAGLLLGTYTLFAAPRENNTSSEGQNYFCNGNL
jgi:hypothetical protein